MWEKILSFLIKEKKQKNRNQDNKKGRNINHKRQKFKIDINSQKYCPDNGKIYVYYINL